MYHNNVMQCSRGVICIEKTCKTVMHEIIKEYEGHILNYIGDSIMVVFGAPQKLKDHENQAVNCALKMKKLLGELNSQWDENKLSR